MRSEDDHSLLKGIQAGEIGPKIHNAMGSLDNGWARFDRVRIPRSHMLARFAQVTEHGEYVRPPHSKLSFGGMIFIRAQMISSLSWRLAKGGRVPFTLTLSRLSLLAVPSTTDPRALSRSVPTAMDCSRNYLASVPAHATSIRRP